MIPGKRPLIGVTGPDRGGGAAWLFTRLALFICGAKALRITPANPVDPEKLDGLIIGGGSDIDPERYLPDPAQLEELKKEKQETGLPWYYWLLFPLIFVFRKILSKKHRGGPDKDRDELEFSLLDKCVNRQIPVLGICRGAQLINVYFGGTLFQDLKDFYEETPGIRSVLPRKEIVLEPDSRLSKILGRQTCHVNALHDQAIKRTGSGITIVAREKPARVVQAIEHEKLDFVIGVQWHPEYLIAEKTQQLLFRALVNACKQKM